VRQPVRDKTWSEGPRQSLRPSLWLRPRGGVLFAGIKDIVQRVAILCRAAIAEQLDRHAGSRQLEQNRHEGQKRTHRSDSGMFAALKIAFDIALRSPIINLIPGNFFPSRRTIIQKPVTAHIGALLTPSSTTSIFRSSSSFWVHFRRRNSYYNLEFTMHSPGLSRYP
jgi:hypothetical protein